MADSKRWFIHLGAILIGIVVVVGVISLRSSRKDREKSQPFENLLGMDSQTEEISSKSVEKKPIPEPTSIAISIPQKSEISGSTEVSSTPKRIEELSVPFYALMRENLKRMETILSLYQKASVVLKEQGDVGKQALIAAKKKTLDPPVLELIKTTPKISDDYDELLALSEEAKKINAKFSRIADYIEKYYDDYEYNPDEIAKELEKQIQEFDQLLKPTEDKSKE